MLLLCCCSAVLVLAVCLSVVGLPPRAKLCFECNGRAGGKEIAGSSSPSSADRTRIGRSNACSRKQRLRRSYLDDGRRPQPGCRCNEMQSVPGKASHLHCEQGLPRLPRPWHIVNIVTSSHRGPLAAHFLYYMCERWADASYSTLSR